MMYSRPFRRREQFPTEGRPSRNGRHWGHGQTNSKTSWQDLNRRGHLFLCRFRNTLDRFKKLTKEVSGVAQHLPVEQEILLFSHKTAAAWLLMSLDKQKQLP